MKSKKENEVRRKKQPTMLIALIPVVFLAFLLMMTIFVWGGDAHIPLVFGTIAAALVGFYLGFSWSEMEEHIIKTITKSMQANLILLAVGMLIAIWIMSGTVPAMIYYGLQIINPKVFLPVVMIVCSIVSLSTGSSWTTAGTVGIAFVGIGAGLKIPPAIVAGAIVSGAYFGDKMSPLSDTTNLAPAVAECDLFDHIRHMIYTTGPTMVISLILYFVIGLRYGGGTIDTSEIDGILAAIRGAYNINVLLLLPPVLVIIMVVRKVPALPGLLAGSLLGIAFYFVFQMHDISITDAGGKIIDVLHHGYVSTTGHALVDKLFTRGGFSSMLWTVSLVIVSMCFGGVMEVTGCLQTITGGLLKFAKNTGGLVVATICSCLFINVISGSQYLSILISGRMFRAEFRKRGLQPKNLSRCLEDGGTLFSPLVPWNTGGAFMHQTLGVHPFAFLPYAFLNIINPIVSIIYGFTGFTMEKLPPEELEKVKAEIAAEKAAGFLEKAENIG